MKRRAEFTEKQYGALMRIIQKKAMEIWAWQLSLGSMLRDDEYALVIEVLEALREAEEVE
ncbi:MAG: hypothetical protein E3J21_08600 [Anaerolineales bacterium]|nr:MAG: hypothetical protein E3J21_08600 [Anaerolineales bacterium]